MFCPSLYSLERGRGRKSWEAFHIHFLCYSDSFATVLYAMILYTDFTAVSMMRAESAYLCLRQPPPGVWTHMGWLSFARCGDMTFSVEHRVGNEVKVGVRVREGGVQWLPVVLVFVTSRRAAVESGPELSRGGGSRELFPRGQQ